MNLKEDDAILDAETTTYDSIILPTYQQEENAHWSPLPQVSPSFEMKELLANLMNLLQQQNDRLERVEKGRG